MNKFNEPIRTDPPAFPYEPEKLDRLIREGDEKMVRTMQLAVEWQKVMASGRFRTWKDLKSLKDNWDGPIVLKGIMSVEVSGKRVFCVQSALTFACRTRSSRWNMEWTV